MSDARMNPEAPPSPTHTAILRTDYRPPDWLVPKVALDFALDPAATRVRATLTVERNGAHDRPLRLAGDGRGPLAVTVDGEDAALQKLRTSAAHLRKSSVTASGFHLR